MLDEFHGHGTKVQGAHVLSHMKTQIFKRMEKDKKKRQQRDNILSMLKINLN